jgi:hypothetical protein
MKLKQLAIAAFIGVLSFGLPSIAQETSAEDPFRPGVWQPVALINPAQPWGIRLTNTTDITLEYSVTTSDTPRPLEPGESATLSDLVLPVYLLINPLSADTSLEFILTVEGDVVKVGVGTRDSVTPGDTTVNINEQGGIYIY